MHSQIYPIDFEPNGIGADWTFTVFQNGSNPPLEIVSNPDPSGINTSNTVAKFTAMIEGAPFAGCETMHGADVGTFTLTPENAYVSLMVYKSVISDVGFKYATPGGASTGEIKVANTLINQWEKIVFDFTPVLDEPSSNGIDQIIIFPDFRERNAETIVYFDSIIFGDASLLSTEDIEGSHIDVYPNPASEQLYISNLTPIIKVSIYNKLGQKVLESKTRSTNQNLNIEQLNSGLYFVSIQTQEEFYLRKLLVK